MFSGFMLFVRSPLFKYLAVALAIFAVLFAAYRHGENHIQDKWDLANAKTEKEIAELREKASKVTTEVIIKYVDRTTIIKSKGDTITQYVDKYISPAEDAKCIIPNNFILLHDSAARNTVPGEVSK